MDSDLHCAVTLLGISVMAAPMESDEVGGAAMLRVAESLDHWHAAALLARNCNRAEQMNEVVSVAMLGPP